MVPVGSWYGKVHYRREGILHEKVSGARLDGSQVRSGQAEVLPGHVGVRSGHVGVRSGHVGVRSGHVGVRSGHIGQAGSARAVTTVLTRHLPGTTSGIYSLTLDTNSTPHCCYYQSAKCQGVIKSESGHSSDREVLKRPQRYISQSSQLDD